MKKTIFLIPGFKTQTSNPMYKDLILYLKSRSYKVLLVHINWRYRTLTDNAEEFAKYFETNQTKNFYVLGFSYGAVIALMTAKKVQPKKLILCSLSPDFAEDRNMMPRWLRKYIGVKRYRDTASRSAIKLANALVTNTVIFYGEKEGSDYPQLKKRCKETARLARNGKLIIVKGAPHDISFPSYREAIMQVI